MPATFVCRTGFAGPHIVEIDVDLATALLMADALRAFQLATAEQRSDLQDVAAAITHTLARHPHYRPRT